MSHTTIEQYSLGAKVISGVWLVVMILTLLDSVYSLNRFLLTDMNNGWFKLQIAVLIIMTVATYCAGSAEIGMSGWLYMKDRDKCGTEIAFAAVSEPIAPILFCDPPKSESVFYLNYFDVSINPFTFASLRPSFVHRQRLFWRLSIRSSRCSHTDMRTRGSSRAAACSPTALSSHSRRSHQAPKR